MDSFTSKTSSTLLSIASRGRAPIRLMTWLPKLCGQRATRAPLVRAPLACGVELLVKPFFLCGLPRRARQQADGRRGDERQETERDLEAQGQCHRWLQCQRFTTHWPFQNDQ